MSALPARTCTLAANLPWLRDRQERQPASASLPFFKNDEGRLVLGDEDHPMTINEDIALLPPVQPKTSWSSRTDVAILVASFLSKTVGVLSMVPGFLSSGGGMLSYDERYNTSARTEALVKKGYRLLFTSDVVKSLKLLQQSRGVILGTNIFTNAGRASLTGAEILQLAKQFDELMSPSGRLAHWMTELVKYEFINEGNLKRTFTAGSMQPHTRGGMMGGYNNAYYGITQFSRKTWAWVSAFARNNGLILPPRNSASFIDQLIAAYVLGVLNQSIMRPYIIGELTSAQLYVAHNQGAGVFKRRKIRWDFYKAQSLEVRRLIRNELRFTIV